MHSGATVELYQGFLTGGKFPPSGKFSHQWEISSMQWEILSDLVHEKLFYSNT